MSHIFRRRYHHVNKTIQSPIWVFNNSEKGCLLRSDLLCTCIHTNGSLSDHILMWFLHGNKMVLIVHQPDHRRSISVLHISLWNKFDSFPLAGIKMIHSLRLWSESCSSLHFYSVHVILFLLMLLTTVHVNQGTNISDSPSLQMLIHVHACFDTVTGWWQ